MDSSRIWIDTLRGKFPIMNRCGVFNWRNSLLGTIADKITIADETNTINPDIRVVDSTMHTSVLSCRACNMSFATLEEQKAHFKSVDHLNRIRGDGDTDSSDDSDSYSDDENTEYNKKYFYESKYGRACKNYTSTTGSTVDFYFQDLAGFDNIRLSISSATIGMSSIRSSEFPYLEIDPFDRMRRTLESFREENIWIVLMARSGRFVGAVFENDKCVDHVSFRRYTVRGKAGGSQSSYDNRNGKAKSVGSSLRRQGEKALLEDIFDSFVKWEVFFNKASLVLVSLPHRMKAKILNKDNTTAVLKWNDPRIQSVPIMTDSPTLEEVLNIHKICSSVTIEFLSKETSTFSSKTDVPSNSEDRQISLPDKPHSSSHKEFGTDNPSLVEVNDNLVEKEVHECPKIIVDCETNMKLSDANGLSSVMDVNSNNNSVDLCSLCRSNSVEDVTNFATLHAETLETFINSPESLETWITPLHIVASRNDNTSEKLVIVLLEHGANPCIRDVRGRTPYQLATLKAVRDAFRRYRGLHEEQWSWEAAGVPQALTEEMEKLRLEKEKEKKQKAKQKKKQEKAEKIEQMEKISNDSSSTSDAAMMMNSKNSSKFSPSDFALFGKCEVCQQSLRGIVPFDVLNVRCCSSDCVKAYRRKVALDAVARRGL